MTKPWRPQSNVHWLTPDDYARLSPLEKKRLWRERQHDRTFQPRIRRSSGKGHYARRRWTMLAVVSAAVLIGSTAGILDGISERTIPAQDFASTVAVGVEANFGQCHTGRGTNCVVDGDTFYLGGEKVRIAGIDAPETHDYRCPSEKALGDRATAELRALLNSGAVTMTSIGRDRDTYGRRLRNVAVDGADAGEALISAGLARAYANGRRSWC